MLKRNQFICFILCGCSILLGACGLFDKDNMPTPTPLQPMTNEIAPQRLFKTNTPADNATDYKKRLPAIGEHDIFTVSTNGIVTAIDKLTGAKDWQQSTGYAVSSSPAVGVGLVVIGGLHGEVIALDESTGQQKWLGHVADEVLAQPIISTDFVLIKTISGTLAALSVNDGHLSWSYENKEPDLILRTASSPLVHGSSLFVGFASGKLSKLNLANGDIQWSKQLAEPSGAFAVQRMIDIDANPIIYENQLYAVTYQGNLSARNVLSSQLNWTSELSSFTGMIAADHAIFLTDASAQLWSFNAATGQVNWLQKELLNRQLSAPAMMSSYLVVGDAAGYLHWISKKEGRYAGRIKTGSAAIFATPLVQNNILYVLTNNGSLLAYKL